MKVLTLYKRCEKFSIFVEVEKCTEQTNEITHGSVVCTSSNNIGSTCTFRCDSGYKLSTTSKHKFAVHQKVCREGGVWSPDYEPQCVPQKCKPIQNTFKVFQILYIFKNLVK